jgi:uncharacterized alpha-E superfamily protein
VLSRLADALYWMARYLERVDGTARLLEANLLHATGEGEPAETRWRPLLGIGRNASAYAALHPDGVVTEARVVRFVTVEHTNPSAVRACLRLARDNARVVRDVVTPEMWEILHELSKRAGAELERADGADALVRFCRLARSEVARLHGVADATMMRGEGFAFWQLGTFVERADMTARLLDVEHRLLAPPGTLLGPAAEHHRWGALLKALSGFEAYQRRHRAGLRAAAVVELLVRDPDFPRSLRFALDRMGDALRVVDDGAAVARPLAALDARLREPPVGGILQYGLAALLAHVVAGIAELDAALRGAFFHTVTELPCAS